MNRKIYFYICLLLLLSSYLFADIRINSSGKVGIKNAILNVNGDFLNYGDLNIVEGSLRFYGNANSSAYSHCNLYLDSFILDKSTSSILTLYSYFIVNNNLYLNSGHLAAYGVRNRNNYLKTSKRKLSLKSKKTAIERNSDFLTLSDGVNIYRSAGILDFSPAFSGNVDVFYTEAVTSGNELPSVASKLDTLALNFGSGALALSKDIKINKLLSIDGGNLNTESYTVTMGESAPIEGEPSDITGTIQGTSISVGTSLYSNPALDFSISSGNDIGTFRALLYKKAVALGNGESIAKRWVFSSDNPPNTRNLLLKWYPNEDNDNNLSQMQIYNSLDNGNSWYALNAPQNITSNPRTYRLTGITSFGDFTISDAIVDASPTIINFDEIWAGNSTSQQVTVNNYENQSASGTFTFPSYISVGEVTVNKSDKKSKKSLYNKSLQRGKSSFSFNIGALSSKTFNITFSPTLKGTYSDNVTIKFNSTNNPSKNIYISGSAINPPDISFSQESISQTQISNTNNTQILTVSNTGEDTLSFSAFLSFRNDDRGSVNVYPLSNPYWTGSCDSSNKTENSLVKAHDTLDGWMKFDITSIPSDAVIDSVIFHGYVNDTVYPYWSITPLSNDPITADANTLNADIVGEVNSGYYLFANETSDYTTGEHSYPLVGTVKNDLTNAVIQGWFAVGIATRDNSSSYYIDFDGWNEANPPYLEVQYHIVNNNWLTINGGTSVNGTISPSGSSNITVGFDSSDLVDGIYSGSIAFTSNDPDKPNISVPVTLTVSTPEISVAPSSIAFGDVIIGNSLIKTFTIENTGNGTLSGNIITPTDFTVTLASKSISIGKKNRLGRLSNNIRNSLAYSITSGASKQYNLEFSPQTEIAYSTPVQITSNSATGTTNLSISGNGVKVDIDVNPIAFNKTLTLGSSENDSLTISTTGSGSLDYTARVIYPTLQRTIANMLPSSTNYATGTCTDSIFTQTSKIRGFDTQDGWMKFDLSSIPDDATIFGVTFHGYVDSTIYPYWTITPLDNDPQTTDATTLNADIVAEANSGYYLHRDETSNYSTGWKTYTLEGSIVTDLQNSLLRNWIAMGVVSRDNSPNWYIIFDGWNEENPPYLSIEYAESDKKWVLLNNVYSVSDTTSESSPDVITVNFDTEGLTEGTYTANISIDSNDPDESTLTIPVSLIVSDLKTPANVQLSVSSGNVIISWDNSGANSYKVYASDTPNGTFEDVTSSGSFTAFRSRVVWQSSLPISNKVFYKITSSNE